MRLEDLSNGCKISLLTWSIGLNETVYVEQLRGYEKKESKHKVYKLHKALYGLNQAPRAWFSRSESYYIKEGFQKNQGEQTLSFKWSKEGKILIVSVYLDDLIYIGDDEFMMSDFKSSMQKDFDTTDLGKMRFFLELRWCKALRGFIYVNISMLWRF